MRLRYPTRAFALALASTAFLAANAQAQDELPFLTAEELNCQAVINDSVRHYLNSVGDARRDCFLGQMVGTIPLAVDCRAKADPGTGDDATDQQLRAAENRILGDVTKVCIGIALEVLGFPGTCDDPNGGEFSALDLELCLRTESDRVIGFLMDVEQPLIVDTVDNPGRICQATIAQKSSRMFIKEYEARAHCSLRQLKRQVSADVQCRAEVDPLAPGTGHNPTDTDIVAAHNRVLREIANDCRAVDLPSLGFPNMCPSGAGNTFPLFSLVDCMFDTHHLDLIPFLDISNPSTKTCGNGMIEPWESCDDGDDDWMRGEVCLNTCMANTICGGPLGLGRISINDALFILRVAVGLETCDLALCDVDSNGVINTTDVLRVLRFVVGLPSELACPAPVIPGL